jgi:hypothetical protein
VDKSVNLFAFNALLSTELAAQTLYLARMSVEQFLTCAQERLFCTTRPVDIQGLLHSPSCLAARSEQGWHCWLIEFFGFA